MTISSIIPWIKGLVLDIIRITDTLLTTEGQWFARRLLFVVKDKLGVYETRSVCRIATILDPRYKKRAFLKEANFQAGVVTLRNIVTERMKSQSEILGNIKF